MSTELDLRHPTPEDGPAVHALVVASGVLDVNSVYAYVLWADRFRASSVVATQGSEIVGFCNGFTDPRQPDTWFCWQVGVSEKGRGQGLATRLLDFCVEAAAASWLETTITPSNTASRRLFRGFARRKDTHIDTVGEYSGQLLGSGHEPEELFRIGPFRRNP